MKQTLYWTKHAFQRQKEWEERLKITQELVEDIITNPEQIVDGDEGTKIAQSRFSNGLIRVVYREEADLKIIITVYFTKKTEKYWRC